jgi:hypothetical protein
MWSTELADEADAVERRAESDGTIPFADLVDKIKQMIPP